MKSIIILAALLVGARQPEKDIPSPEEKTVCVEIKPKSLPKQEPKEGKLVCTPSKPQPETKKPISKSKE